MNSATQYRQLIFEADRYGEVGICPDEMLAHCMETRGISSADVAKQTGIPAATISNVLARRRGISKANGVKLGRFFHVSPATFLDAG